MQYRHGFPGKGARAEKTEYPRSGTGLWGSLRGTSAAVAAVPGARAGLGCVHTPPARFISGFAVGRANAVTRQATQAGCHYWTGLVESEEPRGNAGAGAGVERAGPRGEDRIVSLRVPPFPSLVAEYDARYLVHAAKSTRRHQRTVLGRAARELPEHPTPGDVRDWLSEQIAAGRLRASSSRSRSRPRSAGRSRVTRRAGGSPAWRSSSPRRAKTT